MNGGFLRNQEKKRKIQSRLQVFEGKTLIDLFIEDADRLVNRKVPLTRAQEYELAKNIELGDFSSFEEMVASNVRLVMSIAKKYISWGLRVGPEFSDLVQEGNLGLLRSLQTFDPEKGFKFSTYATFWIRQSIQRSLLNGGLIRIPIHISDLMWKIADASYQFELRENRAPSTKELSRILHLPEAKIDYIQAVSSVSGFIESIDDQVGSENSTVLLQDLIPDKRSVTDEIIDSIDEFRLLLCLKEILDQDEYDVVTKFFGFGEGGTYTQREIGFELGVSESGVRDILQKALLKLRKSKEIRKSFSNYLEKLFPNIYEQSSP